MFLGRTFALHPGILMNIGETTRGTRENAGGGGETLVAGRAGQ